MPHIEKIAQPGMKVVFLIRCPRPVVTGSCDGSPQLNGQEETRFASYAEEATGAREAVLDRWWIDEQRLVAEHKLVLELEALLKRGVEMAVDVYTGSLKTAIKTYTLNGNVHLIVRRVGWAISMMQSFCRMMPGFVLLKQPTFSSVRLLHAN